jgi:hypothetical protein
VVLNNGEPVEKAEWILYEAKLGTGKPVEKTEHIHGEPKE